MNGSLNGRFYQNPVLHSPFADPFVLKHGGEYWGYSTGFCRDGRVFGVAYSRDLVNWSELPGAMEPLPGGHTCYWAPEVSYEQGRFLLYYSVGNEALMHIRVAVAEHPAGPFIDSGHELTREEFAIDPHVFIDDDGARYLFYATDFLKHTHIGTGTVIDRMLDSFTLVGEARPVTRARYDWQVYDPQRATKGGVRWHTVEGPSVLKRKGHYYQMLSGGNWQNTTYGVSFASTENINAQGEWEQASDGALVLPMLRTLPGQVIGPGHNSVVRGPDNQQLFCVYHRWSADGGARVMCIDRLDWVGTRMTVLGPSTSLTAAPIAPTVTDFFADNSQGLSEIWEIRGGQWSAGNGTGRQSVEQEAAEARCQVSALHFIAEVSVKSLRASAEGGCGIALANRSSAQPASWLRALIAPEQRALMVGHGGAAERMDLVPLPAEFNADSFHLLRVEVNHHKVRIKVDEGPVAWTGTLDAPADSFSLLTDQAAGSFAGFALTVGWQDLFELPEEELRETGWEVVSGVWATTAGELRQNDEQSNEALILKGPLLASYELVVNARLLGGTGGYGFCPAWTEAEGGITLWIEHHKEGWAVVAENGAEQRKLALPEDFDPLAYQMFRFRKQDGQLSIQLEGQHIGTLDCTQQPTRIGLLTKSARAGFEMVRLTAITQ